MNEGKEIVYFSASTALSSIGSPGMKISEECLTDIESLHSVVKATEVKSREKE